MRIGIDARSLQAETRHRGIGKSFEFFLQAANGLLRDHDLTFYVDGSLEVPDILRTFSNSKIIYFSSLSLLRKKYIRSIFLPWRALQVNPKDIDVLLQYDASLGVPNNVHSVVIFHDLIPYIFHDKERLATKTNSWRRTLKNRLAGAAYWRQYLRILKRYPRASTIISVSESSKRDYLNHFKKLADQRIVTIPHGVDASFFSKKIPVLSKNISNTITKPYFIYIGGIDYRKNIKLLLNNFTEVRKSYSIQLVLVGKEFSLQDQLNDLGWANLEDSYPEYISDIIRPGFISHDDLIALLNGAEALVFPSLYEGFGMPLLEAMAVGCPVIAYNNSSLPEVIGPYGKLLQEGASLEGAMIDVINNKSLYSKIAKQARKHALSFTWERTATAIIDELKRFDLSTTAHKDGAAKL